MTDQLPVLATRQNGAVTARPAQPAMSLSEVERVCNMIATAGDLTPPAYRGKPGAVLLAKLWGDANGVDLFTAIQNISPIEGRPYVSAEMRVALAVAKGFEFRTIEATREVCTLEVWRAGVQIGTVTARFSDQPRKLKTAKGYDTPWATHPDDMLFAEACRKADRRHVRTGAALIDAGQDYGDTPDPLYVLAAQATVPTPDGDQVLVGDDEPMDAEIVADTVIIEPEPEPDDGQAVTLDDLLAEAGIYGVRRVALLRHAQQKLGWSGGTLEDLVADQHVTTMLVADLQHGEVQ